MFDFELQVKNAGCILYRTHKKEATDGCLFSFALFVEQLDHKLADAVFVDGGLRVLLCLALVKELLCTLEE